MSAAHNNRMRVVRNGMILAPDQSRVLLRPFYPGDTQRIASIAGRVAALPEDEIGGLLEEICAEFSERHQHVRHRFSDRFEQVRHMLSNPESFSEQRRMVIGSYFLAEYSLESAALFNPSMVPHPDQSDLPSGSLRIILSLRATGEGHISSITFREGILHAGHRLEIVASSGFLTEPLQIPNPLYEKRLFVQKLTELGLTGEFTRRVMNQLNDTFALEELRAGLQSARAPQPDGMENPDEEDNARGICILAKSNCEVLFPPELNLSQRILFPATPSQRNGIEDARFVRFRDSNGSYRYYATFTAYDGRMVMPELVETADFLRFRFITLNGAAARNKGMALFPRKIDGRYAMISRQDNESIHLMFSDNVHFWSETTMLLKPAFPWELVQIGNCGSPIETEAGWLVLSHGVGPMRKYCIGAFLLDRDDPSKVIGRLRMPLLEPSQSEREGYVPNVVYSCGALLHEHLLMIPYGLADHATGFATVPVSDVIAGMEPAQ